MNNLERLRTNVIFKKVEEELDRLRLTWGVAGGWCRDVNQQQKPKDIDIIVSNWDYISKGQHDELDVFVKDYLETDHTKTTDDDAYEGGRLKRVLTLKGGIDIIFWSPEYKTVEDVVDAFDFNINQFMLSTMGEIVFMGENKGVLHVTVDRLTELSMARLDKMRGKATDLGWDISEEVNDLVMEDLLPKPEDRDDLDDL